MISSISHLNYLVKPLEFSQKTGHFIFSQSRFSIQDKISRKKISLKDLREEIFTTINKPELVMDLNKTESDLYHIYQNGLDDGRAQTGLFG